MKKLILSLALILSSQAQATSIHPLTYAVMSNNQVGLQFMDKVTQDELTRGEKNVMTSPISLYYALAMAYNGTANQTLRDLSDYMGYNVGDRDFVNDYNQYLQRELSLTPSAPLFPDGPTSPKLGIYNSAWATESIDPDGGTFKFSDQFKANIQEFYSAEVKSLDFKQKSSASVINDWANEKTEGLIPKVIDHDQLKEMMWVLMNATYLEASWAEAFSAIDAEYAPEFNVIDGTKKKVDNIRNTTFMGHMKMNGVEWAKIPFYKSNLVFYVAAPETIEKYKSLRTGEAWSGSFWNNARGSLRAVGDKKVTFTMPKFSFSYTVAMEKNQPLTNALGLDFLFSNYADFSDMAAPGSVPTAVGLIKQDTRIELDENGVKAAAVTTVGGIRTTSIDIDIPEVMTVDKPFFYAIADENTGAILFVGSVVNP
jgi:serpin B